MKTTVTTTITRTVEARITIPICNKCREIFPEKSAKTRDYPGRSTVEFNLSETGGLGAETKTCSIGGCTRTTTSGKVLTIEAMRTEEKEVLGE